MTRSPFDMSSSTSHNRVTLLLLVLSSVETFVPSWCVQCWQVLQKATGLYVIVTDNHLDQTWIADTAPDTIKLKHAPPSFAILHVHRLVEPDDPYLPYLPMAADSPLSQLTMSWFPSHLQQKTEGGVNRTSWLRSPSLGCSPQVHTRSTAVTWISDG